MGEQARPIPSGADLRGGAVSAFFRPASAGRLPMIDRAEGIYMWDTQGRRYIDGTSGPVATNLGHGNRRVLEAMKAQAERVCFAFPTAFESKANIDLADLVTSLAGEGLERAYFVSGGSEATESALKLARQYALTQGEASRFKVVSRMPCYHGTTLGALAVSGDPVAHGLFGPMMVPMPKVPLPFSYRFPANHTAETYAEACADALEAGILAEGPETVLAFIMEPVGGVSSGANVAPDAYYKRVRDICTKYGVLLIYDEVMSGAGRTGAFLAAHHWPDARPDIVTMAKGISAGYMPMGAVLCPAAMVDAVLGSGGIATVFTYTTNPLACAVGHATVLETVEGGYVEAAAKMGDLLRARLEELKEASAIVGDVRGKGLLLAVELVADKETKAMIPAERMAPYRIAELARERGLIQYVRRTAGGAFGEWLMVTPPLIVTPGQIDEIVGILGQSIAAFENELRRDGVIGSA